MTYICQFESKVAKTPLKKEKMIAFVPKKRKKIVYSIQMIPIPEGLENKAQ